MTDLLPNNFDDLTRSAVRDFWRGRTPEGTQVSSGPKQGGGRDSVLSGKNMDGFIRLVEHVAIHCGLDASNVKAARREVVLPGYFRATKNWDVLVVHQKRLLAVFEFKSQVGSFGNNFNNRSEEVLGAAADLWVAHRHGAYSEDRSTDGAGVVAEHPPLLHPDIQHDPRPPFLGWLMLLEDCPEARKPVRCDEPNFPVFPEFRGASYADRYHLLCARLVERRLYGAAALVLSTKDGGAVDGTSTALSAATSLRNLYAEFAAKILAARESS